MKRRLKFKEALDIIEIRNFEKHRSFYKSQLQNCDDNGTKLVTDYHNHLVNIVEDHVVNPFLKSSEEKEEKYRKASLKDAKIAVLSTAGMAPSMIAFASSASMGFLVAGACCFALASANIISGIFSLVKSELEKRKRMDIACAWEYDKTESPVDVLDFCEDNNLQPLTNPFYFELDYVRDTRADRNELVDPFRKNRFKKEARKLIKDGVSEDEYRHYRYLMELSKEPEKKLDEREYLKNYGKYNPDDKIYKKMMQEQKNNEQE